MHEGRASGDWGRELLAKMRCSMPFVSGGLGFQNPTIAGYLLASQATVGKGARAPLTGADVRAKM